MTKEELELVLKKVRSRFNRNMAAYAYDMSGSLMDCMDTALAVACNEVEDEVDRLVKFVKYDRVHQIDVLGGSEAYKEQVRMFRKRGEAMTEGFWTKCWEVEK